MNNSNSLSQNSEKSLTESCKKMFTTREVAEQVGTSSKVVISNAKKCLPGKVFENGKQTYFSELEVTKIIEQMKGSNPNQNTFTAAVKVISTNLTPALRIKQAMDMAMAAYEEELAIIKAENAALKPDAESWRAFAEKSGNYCVTNVARCLNLSRDVIFNYLNVKGYICRDQRTKEWIGTSEGVSRGYVTNEIWTNDIKSGIQMRVTPKGMQKIQQAFSVEIAADSFIEKGEKENQKIIEETADKWIEKYERDWRAE